MQPLPQSNRPSDGSRSIAEAIVTQLLIDPLANARHVLLTEVQGLLHGETAAVLWARDRQIKQSVIHNPREADRLKVADALRSLYRGLRGWGSSDERERWKDLKEKGERRRTCYLENKNPAVAVVLLMRDALWRQNVTIMWSKANKINTSTQGGESSCSDPKQVTGHETEQRGQSHLVREQQTQLLGPGHTGLDGQTSTGQDTADVK